MSVFLLTFCIKSSYMKFQLLGSDCIVTQSLQYKGSYLSFSLLKQLLSTNFKTLGLGTVRSMVHILFEILKYEMSEVLSFFFKNSSAKQMYCAEVMWLIFQYVVCAVTCQQLHRRQHCCDLSWPKRYERVVHELEACILTPPSCEWAAVSSSKPVIHRKGHSAGLIAAQSSTCPYFKADSANLSNCNLMYLLFSFGIANAM